MTEPLTITTSSREDNQLDLTIQLGPERTEEALHQAARQVAKRANVPGFRRGKAPFSAVLRAFGREALLNEVIDGLGQAVYGEALDAQHIEPYAQASLVDVATEPVTFKLVVPLPPAVDLGDYRSIRVEAPEVQVSEADVDAWLDQRRTQRATWEEVDRPAEIGDSVVVDIKGTVGEETIMDNHDWELVLKEEGGWLPGFDESFVGMVAGEDKTFTLHYPEDSTSRYKGQEATFEASVKQVRAHVQPELTDEFAKSLGDYEDLADLRTKVLARIEEQRKAEAEDTLDNAAVEALIEHATVISYPPVIVDETVEEIMHDLEHRLAEVGYKIEDYLRLQGTNTAEYQQQVRPQAEKRAKGRLALGKLAVDEHIVVPTEDIAARLNKMLEGAGDEQQVARLREFLDSERGREIISQDLLTERTMARLREIVTGQVVESAEAVAETPEAGEVAEATEATEAEASVEPPAVSEEETEEAREEGEPTVEQSSEV